MPPLRMLLARSEGAVFSAIFARRCIHLATPSTMPPVAIDCRSVAVTCQEIGVLETQNRKIPCKLPC
jgi:hypothetical protein